MEPYKKFAKTSETAYKLIHARFEKLNH